MFESLVNKKRLLKRDSNRTVIFTLTFSELVMDVGGGGGGGGRGVEGSVFEIFP